MCKINKYIRFVLVFGEFLNNIAFSNTTSPFNKECHCSLLFLLPFQELIIYLSFHTFIMFWCCKYT